LKNSSKRAKPWASKYGAFTVKTIDENLFLLTRNLQHGNEAEKEKNLYRERLSEEGPDLLGYATVRSCGNLNRKRWNENIHPF